MAKMLQSVRILLADGNSWLRDYEVEVLRWFIQDLPLNERGLAARQLAYYDLVQRSPDGKILMFFRCGDDKRAGFDKSWNLKHDGDEFKRRFEIQLHDQRTVAGVVFVTFGRISSIECKLRPKAYDPKEMKIFELGRELIVTYG